MSAHQSKTWLVAYDICEPRRLRQVHRYLRRQGVAAQYSVFTVEADDLAIAAHMVALKALIDTRVDDLRAYHLPARCPVWRLGQQEWPDGLLISACDATRLLQSASADIEAHDVALDAATVDGST